MARRAADGAVAARGGLREQNKLDKLERIRAAARALFTRHGYHATTMRQIAARAHVGLGTLFSYADDKRDLVFLIFNDELEALTERALAAAPDDAPLLDQLVAIFACHYEHFARHAALSRLALQELTFYSQGKQAAAFHAIRGRLIEGLERRVAAAQSSGRIRDVPDAARIARLIFFVYSAAVRWWIARPKPDPAAGIDDLRSLLALQFEGLAPTREAARSVARVAAIRRRKTA